MKKMGSLIVISGPSGVGKSTLISRVRNRMPELEFSISCTTRSPRTGEQHGREYYFLTDEEFLRREANGEFIETAGVFAHRYGTLKSEVMQRLEKGSFQWPRNKDEVRMLTPQQYRWLMEGLKTEQPKANKTVTGLSVI